MIRIICVGKKPEAIYAPLLEHFSERLRGYTKVEWTRLPHSGLEGEKARTEESDRIRQKIGDELVILFDETGTPFTNESLARKIEALQNSSQNAVCIIGGAYGVDDDLKKRAELVLSFGSSVFPHQLVWVMVAEQLYRTYSILAGSRYHH